MLEAPTCDAIALEIMKACGLAAHSLMGICNCWALSRAELYNKELLDVEQAWSQGRFLLSGVPLQTHGIAGL